MTKLTKSACSLLILSLAACGGGGGGSDAPAASARVSFGPRPADSQTLAQIQGTSGQYINSGGAGQSLLIRRVPQSDALDVRANSTDRRLFGFRTTGTANTYEVRVGDSIFGTVDLTPGGASDQNLLDGDFATVRLTSGTSTLDLYSVGGQATATALGGTQSAVVGLWYFTPSDIPRNFAGGFRAGSQTSAADIAALTPVTANFSGTVVARYEDTGGNPSFDARGDANLMVDFDAGAGNLQGQIINLVEIGGATRISGFAFTGTTSGAEWTANINTGGGVIAPGGAGTTRTFTADVENTNRNTISGAFYGPNAAQIAGTFRINDNTTQYLTGALIADRLP